MSRLKTLIIVLFCATLLLSGCQMFNPPDDQGKAALDDFIYALRWQKFSSAAAFMEQEHRADFLAMFRDLDGLNISDVRMLDMNVSAEGRRAEVVLEMEYFLLPSVSLKTFTIDQTWVYFDGDDQPEEAYMIVTPFPPFPGGQK